MYKGTGRSYFDVEVVVVVAGDRKVPHPAVVDLRVLPPSATMEGTPYPEPRGRSYSGDVEMTAGIGCRRHKSQLRSVTLVTSS